MLNKTEIASRVAELKSLNDARKSKYYRNYRRYNYTPFMSLENIRAPSIVGYYETDLSPEEDTTPTPQLNIIKSCIDTMVSKIAQSKVRPFFNCINGDYEAIQGVRQARAFFDTLYDTQKVYETIPLAFRDACIFDTGWVYVSGDEQLIRRALPWQVYARPAELTYNRLTRIAYEQKDFPLSLLTNEKLIKELTAEGYSDNAYLTRGLYYDTQAKVKCEYFPDVGAHDIQPYDADVVPFVPIFFTFPINGSTSQSVVDMLNSIQLEIDVLMAKIKDASQLNPAMTAFLPDDSSIKTSELNNRIGNVIKYRATPNMTTSPVTVMTPAFIDQEYLQVLDSLIQRAYELVGISQLSAQSKKPTGINSGVALATLEDVESDRFETQLNQVIQCYVDVAKICIKVFPQDENILPEASARSGIKWRDITKLEKQMTIQFSAADKLSKDPSTKLQQLQMLAQAGILPQARIAQFMDIPDLEGGFSLAQNAANAVQKVIQDCIKNDIYDVPEFVPFSLLKEEIINTQLALTAAAGDGYEEEVEKLTTLFKTITNVEKAWAEDAAQAQAQAQEQNAMAAANAFDEELAAQQQADATPNDTEVQQ